MSGRRKSAIQTATEIAFCATAAQTPAMRTRSRSRLTMGRVQSLVCDRPPDLQSSEQLLGERPFQVVGSPVVEFDPSAIITEAPRNNVDQINRPEQTSQPASQATAFQMGNTLPELNLSIATPSVAVRPTVQALIEPQQASVRAQPTIDPIDVEVLDEIQPACIDLTNDDAVIEVVDLTIPMFAPPFQTISVVGDRRAQRSRRHPRAVPAYPPTSPFFDLFGVHRSRRRSRFVSVDAPSSSLAGSLRVPSFNTLNECRSPGPSTTAEPFSGSNQENPHEFTCPICLDSATTIKQSGRQIYSTVCGHVFCRNCLWTALKASGVCPTCRKTIRPSQTHPLYI